MAYTTQEMYDRTTCDNAYAINKIGETQFHDDCIDCIMSEYGLNESQAERVYEQAWDFSHSSGYYEVMASADDYAGMVAACLEM